MAIALKSITRNIVTPVTIVTFVVSTVTGIMLLGHWNAGLVRFSHEWLSVVFSAVGLWHLAKNWNAFVGYLKRNAAIAAFAVSLLASLVVTGMTGSTSSVNPGAVFGALSRASLEAAAPAFGLTPVEAVGKLNAANIDAVGGETLAAIGARSGVGAAGVASILAARQTP
jgi:hypothetical protein